MPEIDGSTLASYSAIATTCVVAACATGEGVENATIIATAVTTYLNIIRVLLGTST
jgi:hypothetical protein